MITIIVPTLNHPELIQRHLRYYAGLRFQGSIFVGDSSEGELAEQTQEAVRKYQCKLDVAYHWAPKVHDALCMQQMLDSIKTPYIVFNGDDDFTVPSALDECIDFLSVNPDYSAVHGIGVAAITKREGDTYAVTGASYYHQQVCEDDTAAKRLVYHYTHPAATGFTVQRVETLRARYEKAHEMADRPFASEWLPDSLTVALGKVKELDTFYLIRQLHDSRYTYPPDYDWLTSEQWLPSYRVYVDRMADVIAEIDGIAKEEAQQLVKQAFWDRMTMSLHKGWQRAHGQLGQSSTMRRSLGRIPGVKRTYHTVKSLLPGDKNAMTLEALLRPGSQYHERFMPAYRTMVDPL